MSAVVRKWEPASAEPPDFSLLLGGTLFQLLRRAPVSGDAPELLRRRVVTLSLFAWLPLLVLSAVEGRALGGSVAVPLLRDVEVDVRFLVALPLLVLAELVIRQRIRVVVKQFPERELVPASGLRRFQGVIGSGMRLRNSVLAEIPLITLVFVVGIQTVWRHYIGLATATWYAALTAAGMTLSPAGIWYAYARRSRTVERRALDPRGHDEARIPIAGARSRACPARPHQPRPDATRLPGRNRLSAKNRADWRS